MVKMVTDFIPRSYETTTRNPETMVDIGHETTFLLSGHGMAVFDLKGGWYMCSIYSNPQGPQRSIEELETRILWRKTASNLHPRNRHVGFLCLVLYPPVVKGGNGKYTIDR